MKKGNPRGLGAGFGVHSGEHPKPTKIRSILQANAHMAARLALLKFGNWWAR